MLLWLHFSHIHKHSLLRDKLGWLLHLLHGSLHSKYLIFCYKFGWVLHRLYVSHPHRHPLFRVAWLVARPLCHWAVVIAGATAFAATAALVALFIAGAALWIYNPILTRLIGRK